MQHLIESAQLVKLLGAEISRVLKAFYSKLNSFLPFWFLLFLFLSLFCFGVYLAFLIVSKNAQGGEVFVLIHLKDEFLGDLVRDLRFQSLCHFCWGGLALGSSSEILLTLIMGTLFVLAALLGLAYFKPLFKLALGGLLLNFFFIFYRLAVLALAGPEWEQYYLMSSFDALSGAHVGP